MLEGISPDQLQMTDIPRLIWIPVREAVKLRWERNPKQHDLGVLAESFRKHGFKQIPHYDSNIGIDDGNGRVECLDWMERQGQPIVRGIAQSPDGAWVMPLIVGVDDKSKALAEAYAIDANNLVLSGAEFAPWEIAKLWDEQRYLSILQELASNDALPVSVDGDALNSLLQEPPAPEPKDAGELVDKAAELQAKWQVQRGDVWQVGKHRVMCGDSTNAADVARLMGGEKANACVTDPPYGIGVNYGRFQDTEENVKSLIDKVLPIILEIPAVALTPGFPSVFSYPLPAWMGVWVHPAPNSRCPWGFCGTNPILYYGKDPYLAAGKGCRPDSIVMAADREGIEGHPTPKPVKVWTWLVERMTTQTGQIVYDPFLGSGTTLVACEQTGRIGRGMEIEPKYCAVTLERLSLLGLTPKKVD